MQFFNKSKLFLFPFFVVMLFVLESCNIKEPTAPNWDVSFNIPITNKSYTLFDIIEKKSSDVKHYTEGDSKDILYYSQTKDIESISLDNKIKIDPFSDEVSKSIGTININDETTNALVDYSWINSSYKAGQSVSIPQISNAYAGFNMSGTQKFRYVKIVSGNIDVSFSNYFASDVAITINSFVLKNSETEGVVIQSTTPIVVQSNTSSSAVRFSIPSGITVNSQLKMECRISTNGSNNKNIVLPNYSLGVTAVTNGIKVSEANAVIPEQQPINISGSFTLDQNSSTPTQIISAKLQGGLLGASITNNLSVDVNIVLSVDNLQTTSGTAFSISKFIPAKSTVNLFSTSTLNIANYSFVSSNGSPTNVIAYKVQASVLPTSDFRILKSTDNVTANAYFNNISVMEFSGKIKPFNVDEKRTSISLSVKDVQDKMQFQQIDFKNPILELRLDPTSNVEFEIEGRIEAKNSRGENGKILLNNQTLSSTIISGTNRVVSISPTAFNNFLKSFKQFPDSLTVYVGGTVNPNYQTVNVKNTDKFTGKSIMEIPFEFGLTGGEFSDSVEVDLTQDNRDNIKDINTLSAQLNISNGIGTTINFVGRLYDKNNKMLMYFPPKYQDQDTVVTVAGAAVDSYGNVTTANVQTIPIKISQEDSDKLAEAAYMRTRIVFCTTDNKQVKFKTGDEIKITASGSTNYHVNP